MKLIRDYNFATVFGEDPVVDSRDIPTYVNVKFKYRRTNEGARSQASDSNFNQAANRSLVYPLEDRNRRVVGPSWYLGGKSNALTSILCISNSCFALWRKGEGLGTNATKGVSRIRNRAFSRAVADSQRLWEADPFSARTRPKIYD